MFKNKSNGRGLVVIYDPHSLQQFLWYYCTYGKDVRWDALCLPNGYKGTYMHTYCETAGVFENVMIGETDYMNMSWAKKIILFIVMFWYYITFRRESFCEKVLNQYVGDINVYEELVCICETGFVSGLMALLGKRKKVSYFDDGLGEYCERSRWRSPYIKSPLIGMQGMVLALMGYGCKGRFYFSPTRYCYKYSAVTKEMLYTNYKKMLDIDFQNTDIKLYEAILQSVYPGLEDIDVENVEAIFFTEDLDCFSPSNYQKYASMCAKYIGKRHKSVILKRHPKDFAKYDFGEDVIVKEINNEIPAELLLGLINNKRIYFNFFSSIIIFMQAYKYDFELLYMNELLGENLKSASCKAEYYTKDNIEELCKRFADERYVITEIN